MDRADWDRTGTLFDEGLERSGGEGPSDIHLFMRDKPELAGHLRTTP